MGARIGTAGWSIARADADAFPAAGTALERYARVFDAVEVNSSFHRSHRPSTWAKWAASVPEDFRFCVKIPKTITRQAGLIEVGTLVASFTEEVRHLGRKLALLLVQLPPKLSFDAEVAKAFFTVLRHSLDADVACEPRHASWFEDGAEAVLRDLHVARVAADPALGPAAAVPGGWHGTRYWRLHGSPAMYRSSYDGATIEHYASRIRAAIDAGHEPWCMFDNTAAGAATGNALSLIARLGQGAMRASRHDPRGEPTASR